MTITRSPRAVERGSFVLSMQPSRPFEAQHRPHRRTRYKEQLHHEGKNPSAMTFTLVNPVRKQKCQYST